MLIVVNNVMPTAFCNIIFFAFTLLLISVRAAGTSCFGAQTWIENRNSAGNVNERKLFRF